MINHQEFLVSFLPGEIRTLSRTGLRLHDLQYWADPLAQWVGQHKKVRVYYDPRDITVVYVRTPAGVLVRASVTTSGVPAISLAEWGARRNAERAACKHPDLVAIADASQKRGDVLVSQAKASRRVRRRQATAAAGDRWRAESAPTEPTPLAVVEFMDATLSLPTLSATPTFFEVEEYDDVADR